MMKAIRIVFFLLTSATTSPILAQNSDSIKVESWEFLVELNNYFLRDGYLMMPVANADRGRLHLEGRYNYEDLNTASFFAGYNFSAGKKLELDATPILGFALGNSQGVIPGVEFSLTLNRLSFYSETEWLISTETREDDFLYTWSEITWTATDWFSFGISGQRTRLYQTELELQRGPLARFEIGKFTLTGYVFNVDIESPFVLVTAGVAW